MAVSHSYRGVDWTDVESHLAQFHLHEPRNRITATSSVHEPTVAKERLPDGIKKNALSPASSPGTLVEKYRYTGYTVMALTEHEYYIDRTKRKDEPYSPEFDVTSWPWTEWGVDPDELGMVPIRGAELRGYVPELERTHDVLSLDTDVGHGKDRDLGAVIEEVGATGGLAYLAHPAKYVTPEEWELYRPHFEATDALLGVEVFNANDRYPAGRELWDRLLTHFGADRPIWAIANDDYHARPRKSNDRRFDRSRNVLLLPERSREAVRSALVNGQYYVQYNDQSMAPFIETIEDDGSTITIRAPDARAIEWIGAGETLATGSTVALGDLPAVEYVRAELHGAGEAVTCTQPFYLE